MNDKPKIAQVLTLWHFVAPKAGGTALQLAVLCAALLCLQTALQANDDPATAVVPKCDSASKADAKVRVRVPDPLIRKSLRIWRNVKLIAGEAEIPFDVYRPDDSAAYPLVLMIHGGAWSSGDKRNLELHAKEVVAAGFVAVSTNYRLAPDHKFPTQVCDCSLVLDWLLSSAAPFGAEPDRYAVWGYSAGAQLAALLAIEHAEDNPPVCCVAGGIPADFQWVSADSKVLAPVFGGTPAEKPQVYLDASPLEHVTSRLCPFFLYHGTRDFIVPPEVSRRMHARLRTAGVDSELLEVLGKEHLLTFLDRTARRRSVAFLVSSFSAAKEDR